MKVFLTALSIQLIGLCCLIVPVLAEVEKDGAEKWIQDLGSETFQVRERASHELWKLGRAALPTLREAMLSGDPEVVMRAKEAVENVELQITVDTPEEILALIDDYRKAPSRQKMDLLNALREKNALYQMLKLYSMENAEEQGKLSSVVEDVSLIAAREAILAEDRDLAIELLRMAPRSHRELMALACFYRSIGQLEQELTNLAPPPNVNAEQWKGYLLRAKGDYDGAIEIAEQTNQPELLAGLKVLKGDPVPWLESNHALGARRQNPHRAQQAYIDIALKRWRGEEVHENDFDQLEKLLKSNSRLQRTHAMVSLATLGKFGMLEEIQNKENTLSAFLYYLSREEIEKALEVFGLNPDQPDYKTWVNEQFAMMKEGEHSETVINMLSNMAAFMEKRGLEKELDEAFSKPLSDLKEANAETYWIIVSRLFMGDVGAPHFITQHVSKWAGEDEERWGEVFSAVFGGAAIVMDWLGWIREIDPEMKDREALEAMLAIFKMSSSPGNLRETWMNRLWKAVQNEKDKDLKLELVNRIRRLCISQQDVINALKAWDMLDEEQRALARWGTIDRYFSAAGRWEDAAKILLNLSEENFISSAENHARIAATLRRGGMEKEARVHDDMADQLALGSVESSIEIGNFYIFAGDFERANIWFRRAAIEADPNDYEFLVALEKCAEQSVRGREWELAASCHEVIVHFYASQQYRDGSLPQLAKARMQADLARAMSILPENKERALQTLKTIHEDFMPDGVLADDFFPALREVGLNKELEQWFGESWDFMVAVIEKYPKSHNSRNTAAWFASRAGIKLAEAEKYLAKALEMTPEQAAYLDTMAELKFAQGNRKAALEWSQSSVCFAPFENMIRYQHERFRTAPLPKN